MIICRTHYRVGYDTTRVGWRIGHMLIARIGWRILIAPHYF